MRTWCYFAIVTLGVGTAAAAANPPTVNFNRDIRPILSNNCYQCHGPDEDERQGTEGFRLDTPDGPFVDLGDSVAIVRGKPDQSELIRRITTTDDDRMPPSDSAKSLTKDEIRLLTDWIAGGAEFAGHWSYVRPGNVVIPDVTNSSWRTNPVDSFVASRLEREGLTPAPAADLYTIARRVCLDLTGLPPSWEDVQRFVGDSRPGAYERYVDRILSRTSYGEHWARMWLDLSRYADSAGYADDPKRTIWGFRDYVIQSINRNKPFDQFSLEQLAGDLLPSATTDQLMATAFHRNTLTNSEGGTNDEEFRNVAIVDRVNTTMSVWMGTTIACAQCHNHKYDPISQREFFQLFAFFNNTQDADRRDEAPVISLFSDDQRKNKTDWTAEIDALKTTLSTPTAQLKLAAAEWETALREPLVWQVQRPVNMSSNQGASFALANDHSIRVDGAKSTEIYEVDLEPQPGKISALRLETLTDPSLPNGGPGHGNGNFVLSRFRVQIVPPDGALLNARFVRIELPGKSKILSLAEVQVFSDGDNVATQGKASQSSTAFNGPPNLAIDGKTNGDYNAGSVTHTATTDNPWWEVDLQEDRSISRVVVWNRTDNNLQNRLNGYRVQLLDANRKVVWERVEKTAPERDQSINATGIRDISLAAAFATFSQDSFAAATIINNPDTKTKGWAVSPQTGRSHELTILPASPITIERGTKLRVSLDQLSQFENHTIGKFRLSVTGNPQAAELAAVPPAVSEAIRTELAVRTPAQQKAIFEHFAKVTPALSKERNRLAALQKQLSEQKPYTTLPVLRELAQDKRRVTRIQRRGNFLEVGDEVHEGVPETWHSLPEGAPRTRLTLAKWILAEENPLTARVIVNRYWEQIFGIGLVRTSEDFGAQGELPSHPQLLDWLANDFVSHGWDVKRLVRLLVTSSTYRQSSEVSEDLFNRDPENRLLARGPRFRLSAEMVRDQALHVAGLLSDKMFGASVQPPRPRLGLRAAFGSSTDWMTSPGEDRFRRGLYTEWRRSLPYPSMATFDAPNREVCTVRRSRTNTPLQALVTMNDPVYVEAAQALARRMFEVDSQMSGRIRFAYRLCLSREPKEAELQRLTRLFEMALKRFQESPELAMKFATEPIGPLPEGRDAAELAALAVLGNVVLNLDETLMKR